MKAHNESLLDSEDAPNREDNVIAFRPRSRQTRRTADISGVIDMQRYPVDIRGYVTFGRLLSGLSSVGLTVHVDPRSGRMVIADEVLE